MSQMQKPVLERASAENTYFPFTQELKIDIICMCHCDQKSTSSKKLNKERKGKQYITKSLIKSLKLFQRKESIYKLQENYFKVNKPSQV